MIIYGWNTKNIKQAPLEGFECPNCGAKNSFLAIFAHYAHIFWIPIFPYKKSAIISCANCQHTTEEKALPQDMKQKMGQLKSSVGIPKYLFSGLVILLLGVGYIAYSSNQSDKEEQSYIDSPQIGDVYVMKDLTEKTEFKYYLLKVNDIVGDSLMISVSSYSYNGFVTKLDPADGFYNVSYATHKDDIKLYDETGELKKVIRDYTASSGFDRVIEFKGLDSLTVE